MIKILDCKNRNYFSKLRLILEKRIAGNRFNTDKVVNIVKDVKKNKYKALLKYENGILKANIMILFEAIHFTGRNISEQVIAEIN